MRSPPILRAVWQAVESLRQTSGAGSRGRDRDLRHRTTLAYLNRNDPYHSWAVALMKQVRSPMLTTEPVLTEVAYFLRADRVDVDPLFQMLERNAVRVDLQVATHWPRLRTLMARYNQMDLANASIVVLSERHMRCQVLTVDRKDFSVYRRNDRQVIDFVAPPKS